MQTFAIVRRSGWNSARELERSASRASRVAAAEMSGRIDWIRSYVLEHEDGRLGTICIYRASDDQAVREHARRVGLPADEIYLVRDTVVIQEDPAPEPLLPEPQDV